MLRSMEHYAGADESPYTQLHELYLLRFDDGAHWLNRPCMLPPGNDAEPSDFEVLWRQVFALNVAIYGYFQKCIPKMIFCRRISL